MIHCFDFGNIYVVNLQGFQESCYETLVVFREKFSEKDFAAMAAAGMVRESTIRTVLRCDLERHLEGATAL